MKISGNGINGSVICFDGAYYVIFEYKKEKYRKYLAPYSKEIQPFVEYMASSEMEKQKRKKDIEDLGDVLLSDEEK